MLIALTVWAFPVHAKAQNVHIQLPIIYNSADFSYTSDDLIIKDNVLQQPAGFIAEPVAGTVAAQKPVQKASVSSVPKKTYSAAANGDIQIRMKAKVVARWGESEWPAMHYMLDHESGGDPYAQNPTSSACGIPQAVPCSKMLKVIGSLDNVDGQLDWMLNYIASRYGTPTKAMQFHQSHNWY